MTKTLSIQTDDHGYYHATENFSPPGPFGFHVDIYLTLTAPPGTRVEGSVALNSEGGGSPQSKTFVADTGTKISLGSWYIPHASNIAVVTGQTSPSLVNTGITFDLEADVTGF
ncbi:MAG TPA: hypothetical protein VKB84_13290 [Candidatus Binataceae bacterium]|nr:hypothetical protein [Candidatus Binataceae bacterium]